MDSIIGSSGSMERLRAYLPKLAASEASVLITGETGTGKERLAEAIHAHSPRHRAPMVRINCAAIPDGLLESELFGHERGAFTGAHAAYCGKLRLANGGTVFLDEIGEMSLYAQAKVLRVLETRELLPLGGTRAIPLDVRFITATNQDLESLVLENRFRSDLFYRINVARLFLPPLRERREDILVFFKYFLTEFNRRSGLAVGEADGNLRPYLLAYDWPGNVRELRNSIERAKLLARDNMVAAADLNLPIPHRTAPREAEHFSREVLEASLREAGGNISRAAQSLGLSRQALYRRLERFNLRPQGQACVAAVRDRCSCCRGQRVGSACA
jgi:transcriptional regulator with PAS, ATPase and Fis domain